MKTYEQERDEFINAQTLLSDTEESMHDARLIANWANTRAEKVIEKHIEYGAFQLNERVKSDNALDSANQVIADKNIEIEKLKFNRVPVEIHNDIVSQLDSFKSDLYGTNLVANRLTEKLASRDAMIAKLEILLKREIGYTYKIEHHTQEIRVALAALEEWKKQNE